MYVFRNLHDDYLEIASSVVGLDDDFLLDSKIYFLKEAFE
jgi:hypothetical protein